MAVKRAYGDMLVLHGGMNALLWEKQDEMEAVVRQQVPRLMQNGGVIFATDHSISATVGATDLRRIVAVVQEVGRYA